MTTSRVVASVPVIPVLLAGLGAQVVDDVAFGVFPPAAVLGPLSGALAILLTVVAARVVTRGLTGSTVARTGLAVGVASAGIGLVIGGLGFITVLLAGITVLAGVAGAVARRGLTTGDAA